MTTDQLKNDLETAGLFNGETKGLGDMMVLFKILSDHNIKFDGIKIREHTEKFIASNERFLDRLERIKGMNKNFKKTPSPSE